MTQKQLSSLKKDLPGNWRVLVQYEFARNGKTITLQSLTDFFNGKFKDPARISEIITHINSVKKIYSEQKNKNVKLL
jgi:hypothetical protein